MIKEAIAKLVEKKDLAPSEMAECMMEIMEGKCTDSQIGAFLTALRMKGETVDEITQAALIMRKKAITISSPPGTIDTCGTGGDLKGTFNISTTSAIVVSAAGVPVAKHGNRGVSSQAGSADIAEALGIKIDLPPEKVEKSLFETGFGFLFAPQFHPAMKYAIGPRREIGIRTIFNILGPLTNPANAKRQLLGVFRADLTETLAQVLCNLSSEYSMIVHGRDGMDEVTLTDETKVTRCLNGRVETFTIRPEEFGFNRVTEKELKGGDKDYNANITLQILSGHKGPKRDVVVMNSALALIVAGKAKGYQEARMIIEETIDSGAAEKKLKEIVKFTQSI
ncbi:MAG: anthranilate phosphoribosyltransferase [Thermodesulfovibrionales bacterium]